MKKLEMMIKKEVKECKEDGVSYDLESIGRKFIEYGYSVKEITKAYNNIK